ncbi:MAG: type IV pilus modification PilV family protein [Dethiobacteria bacterium]|jgi:prepilin-type N-terminal cleavage/methylation domain-containing protein
MPVKTGEEGFSLIEIIAVAAILGVILVPVLSMFAGASFATLLAGEETVAAALAQERMEELKGAGYSALEIILDGKRELLLEETPGSFRRETLISSVGVDTILPGEDGELIFLEVTVFWGDGHGRSLSLSSHLGEGLRQ